MSAQVGSMIKELTRPANDQTLLVSCVCGLGNDVEVNVVNNLSAAVSTVGDGL